MAEDQIKQLRQKLQAQDVEFQNYREECKSLQKFLESELQKKETQVRKLKEESINKQKIFKNLKTENANLTNQLSAFKKETGKQSELIAINQELRKKYEQITLKLQETNTTINKREQRIAELEKFIEQNSKKLQESQNTILQIRQQQQKHLSSIKQLQKKNQQYEQKIQYQQGVIKQLRQRKLKLQDLPTSHKQTRDSRIISEKTKKVKQENSNKSNKITETLIRYQQKIQRYEKIIKQLKLKLAQKQTTNSSNRNKQQQQSQKPSASKNYIACYILTKQYYLSPIMQINYQGKFIKLFKSSRNGCFQKSLGATKHKVDVVCHDISVIVKEVVDKIINFPEDYNHSILIYGVKRSNKKQIMSTIITKMFNFLRKKVQNTDALDLEAIFIKKSSDQQLPHTKQIANNPEQILDLLQKVSNLPQSQQDLKKTQKPTFPRKPEKPRIFYFSLRIDYFSIQISASSFTNIPYRQKQILTTFYNNTLYSKLPDILQPSCSQKYIILTLNPIVDQYEDCKNCLSVTLYKTVQSPSKGDYRDGDGMNKEALSQMAKRKLEIYQKEIQQNSIKIRKTQDQCFYYKSKFDELQNRLKTLISTHHAQSAYLKKSPILLSYQKLLKFIHAIQSKSLIPNEAFSSTLKINALDFNFGDQSDDQAV